MGKIISYVHHGVIVFVDEDLKGKHRKHCLCWRCRNFTPDDRENNCRIASLNYAMCQLEGLVTPVYECPEFDEAETKEL